MRRRGAAHHLDTPILQFGDQMSRLTFDSLFALSTFTKARNEWAEQIEALKEFSRKTEAKTGKKAYSQMWSRLIADDIRSFPPKPVAMALHGGQDKQLLEELGENLKRQANWLFVTGFESYEEFLKATYAALGYLDRTFWVCSDFGDLPADGLSRLSPSWFREQVWKRRAHITPDRILKNLRKNIPELGVKEDLRPLDLRMWTGICAFFRNAIVHSRGLIPKDGFWDVLSTQTGYSFKGKSKETKSRHYLVTQYLEDEGNEYSITMVDRSGFDKKGPRVDDPLHRMLERLANHGLLVYSLLAERFEFTSYWERNKKPQQPPPP